MKILIFRFQYKRHKCETTEWYKNLKHTKNRGPTFKETGTKADKQTEKQKQNELYEH